MAEPRYCPRDFCVPPALFGKVLLRDTFWRPIPIPNADQLPLDIRDQRELEQKMYMDASRRQHAYAFTIRHFMTAKNLTLTDYAKLTGRDSAKRIGAYLRGEVVMRFDDLAFAEHLLGDVEAQVQRYETVFRRRDQALSLGIDMRMGTPGPDPSSSAAPEALAPHQERARPAR